MGDTSAREAYDFLIAQLKSIKGLEWVAEQVEVEVALGSLAQEQISVADGTYDALDSRLAEIPRSGGKARFLSRAEYTPREKFDIVAQAIESVVIGGVKIQSELVRAISAKSANISIVFEPGEIGTLRHGYESLQNAALNEASLHLQRGIAALREEVTRAD